MPEDQAPQGSGHEADREGRHGREGGGERAELRTEEQLAEDQGGRRAVNKEVVPLDGGPYKARAENLFDVRRVDSIFPLGSLHVLSWSLSTFTRDQYT